MLHAFALLFAWSAARGGGPVVFGPRFAVYPAVVQLGTDGRPGLDVDLALVEDQSAIDRLCRLALEQYRAWTCRSPGALEVTADGVPVQLEPDATFHAPGARTMLVRGGGAVTALDTPAEGPPFPDSRLD
jgi:hypothetical protein